MIGLKILEYWETEPRYFQKMIRVYIQKEELRAREMDTNNFNLGKYIALAVNDPKKYPKRPFLAKEEERKMNTSEMESVARRFTIKAGGLIKHKNNGKDD